MAKKQELSMDRLLDQVIVKEEDKPYEVPGSWIWTKLFIYCDKLQYGYTQKASSEQVGPHYLRITDIQDNKVIWDEVPYCIISKDDHIKFKLFINDIVVARTGATTGKSFLIEEDKGAVFASYLIRISLNRGLLPRYLYFFMSSNVYWKQIIMEKKGIAQPGVNANKLGLLDIPVPPLLEQQRIVDIIESLFTKLDRAKELIENALDSFEERKAAILHKAFTGELTKKWREENYSIPVEFILKDIEEERYRLQKKHSASKKFSYKKSVQIEMNGRTKGIDNLFELPKTWYWVSLGQVTWSISDGPHFSPNYVDKEVGVPIISARNVKYKNIDFSDAKYVSKEDYQEFIKRGKPELGDVLLTKGGTTGISTTVDIEEDFCIWVHVALLKIIKKYVSPEYIRDVLASTILYRQSQEQTHGVGNQDLGLTRMVYMALPLPPLEEQEEIVRILDKLLEKEQKAKELCGVIEQIEHMKKSILARAFRGELGTNNPEEESALDLLKEVLEEKL